MNERFKRILLMVFVFVIVVKIAKCQDLSFTSLERDSADKKIKGEVTITVSSGKTLYIKYRGSQKVYDVHLAITNVKNEICFSTQDGWHVWHFLTAKNDSESKKQNRPIFDIIGVTEVFADNKSASELTYYKRTRP